MRFKMISTTVIAWAALAIIAPNAHADDFLWLGVNPSTGWTDQSNWLNLDDPFLGGYPNGPDDNAFITIPGRVQIMPDPATGGCGPMISCNLNINSGDVRIENCTLTVRCKLTIKPGASLSINSGGTLILTGDDVTHEIGGDLKLTASDSILRIEGDATFDPHTQGGGDPVFGKVRGQDDAAEVQIKRDKTLTNNITFCGRMIIRSWPF